MLARALVTAVLERQNVPRRHGWPAPAGPQRSGGARTHTHQVYCFGKETPRPKLRPCLGRTFSIPSLETRIGGGPRPTVAARVSRGLERGKRSAGSRRHRRTLTL